MIQKSGYVLYNTEMEQYFSIVKGGAQWTDFPVASFALSYLQTLEGMTNIMKHVHSTYNHVLLYCRILTKQGKIDKTGGRMMTIFQQIDFLHPIPLVDLAEEVITFRDFGE